jgi:hypothetical protein
MRRMLAGGITAGLLALTLVGCSNGASDEPTESATAVDGSASCEEPTILTAVRDDFDANYPGSTFVSLDDYTCVDGWAMADVEFEASGDTFPTVVFLRAEGDMWVPTTIEDICATPKTDSTMPEEMYVAACGLD